jgi:hypothetical protein
MADGLQAHLRTTLESTLNLIKDLPSRTEFVEAFEKVLAFAQQLKASNAEDMRLLQSQAVALTERLKAANEDDFAGVKAECEALMARMLKEHGQEMKLINDKVSRIKEGTNGHTPTRAELTALMEPLIPEAIAIDEIALANSIQADIEKKLPQYATAFRDALELLSGDDRLDINAIRGIEELKGMIDGAVAKAGSKVGWGAHPLTIQQSGVVKAKVARVINFTGATVSLSPSGVITVAITGGAGGGYTVETPTGSVNGSNKTFTVTADPVYVVIDGITYFDGDGYTLAGTTITTIVAPTGFIRSFHA